MPTPHQKLAGAIAQAAILHPILERHASADPVSRVLFKSVLDLLDEVRALEVQPTAEEVRSSTLAEAARYLELQAALSERNAQDEADAIGAASFWRVLADYERDHAAVVRVLPPVNINTPTKDDAALLKACRSVQAAADEAEIDVEVLVQSVLERSEHACPAEVAANG